jgi:hypothetical protein
VTVVLFCHVDVENKNVDIKIFMVSYLSSTPSVMFTEHWDSFPGLKLTGHEVDLLPPPSAKVKKDYSDPPVCFHSTDIENFTSSLSFNYSSIWE